MAVDPHPSVSHSPTRPLGQCLPAERALIRAGLPNRLAAPAAALAVEIRE